jgi:chromosome segregation ATPase
LRAWITGRRRKTPHPVSVRSVESETRIRALQEEIRVMQRLMDQARVTRETHTNEVSKATTEISALRAAAGERDERLAGMETMLREETARAGKMREEVAELAAQLARSKQETKDLETELSVVQSGAGMSAISEEIARLSAERDELSARLERMTRPVVVAK